MLRGLFLSFLALAVAGSAFWFFPQQPRPTFAMVPAVTPDPSFPVTNGAVLAQAVGADGTLYIGGTFTSVGPNTGSAALVDATSGTPTTIPIFNNAVNSVVSDGSGGWFLGGTFTMADSTSRSRLAHVRSDGSLDPTWDPSPNNTINVLYRSGTTLYVGGAFTTIAGVTRNRLAALDTTSGAALSWDPNVGGAGSPSVRAILQSGSTLYIGGTFTLVNGATTRNRLAALDTTSGTASSWNPNINNTVQTLALTNDTATLYIGGLFTLVNAVTGRNRLAAISTSTGTASSWNPNIASTVNAIVLSGDNTTLYVGGLFITVNGGTSRNRLAAIDTTTGTATSWDPNIGNGVSTMVLSGTQLYIGGLFSTVNGSLSRGRVAVIDTVSGIAGSWSPYMGNSVSALAISGGSVFVGGNLITTGALPRNNLAAIDPSTGTVTSWDPNVGSTIRSMVLLGSTLYIAGEFTTVNGATTRNRLAAIDTTTGTATSWDPNVDAAVYSIAVAPDASTVYAGGFFTSVNGGTTRRGLASFTGATGTVTSWNPDPQASVQAMALTPDGSTLYIGGQFTTLFGATTRNRLAAFETTGGTVTAWNPNASSTVFTLIISGSTVYAGGDFTTVNGGTTRNFVAAFDATSGTATAWNPNADSQVSAIAVDGSTIYIGGSFNTIGGASRPFLAAVDSVSGVAAGWNPSPDGGVGSGASQGPAIVVDGTTVYVGGTFSNIGSVSRPRLAAFRPPTVQFASASSTVAESAGTTSLSLTLSAASSDTVSVDYAVTDGTATAGSDYTLSAGTASFAPGITAASISVTVISDNADESDETVTVQLSNPVNATTAAPALFTLTIMDDDGPDLSVGISDGTSSLTPDDTPTYVLTVTNPGPSTAVGILLTADLPDVSDFIAASDGGTADGNRISWHIASLAPGSMVSRTLLMQVHPTVPDGIEQLAVLAEVSDDGTAGPDAASTNDQAVDIDTLIASGHFTIRVATRMTAAIPGRNTGYRLRYGNTGNQDVADTFVSVRVPAFTRFAKEYLRRGWTCTPDRSPGSTCTHPVGTLSAQTASSVAFGLTVLPTLPDRQTLLGFRIGIGIGTRTIATRTIRDSIERRYTVQDGDTMWKLAERFYGDGNLWVLIQRANDVAHPELLQTPGVVVPGWVIRIPPKY